MSAVRVAILSDVHANLEALEAVLERAASLGVEEFWVLGDLVGYGADPVGVVDQIGTLSGRILSGNHDLATVGLFDLEWFNPAAAAAVRWTQREIGAETREFLEGLTPSLEGDDALLVHGSPRDPAAEYLTDVITAAASFEVLAGDLCFFGHTHVPLAFMFAPEGDGRGRIRQIPLIEGEDLRLDSGVRYLINPGSVGQPRDGDPRASLAVFDGGRVTLHRIEYAVERAQRKIRDAGLPEWLADRLAVGR
jgi:diadenosine tetraphosphatase ApaH/serine/threonine PP2A family protein phosphatase